MKKSNLLGILSSAFLRFCRKFSMKIIFYLLVKTNKPKLVAFLVFVCTTASFTLTFRLLIMYRNETPSWLPSQNSE